MKCRINGTSLIMSVLFGLLCAPFSAGAAPESLTYQGRILKSDGTPLEYSNVSFQFEITNPNGQCIIYREQIDHIDMTNSSGVFDVPIGGGTQSHPNNGTFTLLDAFNNSTTFTCAGGSGTYNAASGDQRRLRVRFHDGSGWKTISPDNVIRSVPFAAYSKSSEKLGPHTASEFVLKNSVTACPANSFLTFDGTNFSCQAVTGASGGTVTTVSSANSYLSVTNGSSTPLLTLNVGTGAGTVAAGNDARFSDARPPTGTASGDLAGSYPNPSVAKLRGVDVANTVPSTGQFLRHDGTAWTPAGIGISDVTNLSATLSTHLTTAAFNAAVDNANCAAHETAYWNSVAGEFLCQPINVSVAGDVSGTIGAVSVDKIRGVSVDVTAPTSGQVLKFDGTKWAPAPDNSGAGTVTSVSGTAPLSVATGSSTPVISISQSNATTDGYLSSADWNAFNSKQPAGNYVTSLTGDVTATGPGAAPSTVAKLQGQTLTLTSPNSGEYLRFNGTAFVNTPLISADIPSLDWSKISTGKPTTLSGYGITDALISNAGGTPSIQTGTDAAKPVAPGAGAIYFATDTKTIYQFNSGSWVSIASINASAAPSGLASGDLSGSYPGPTVAKIQGYVVDATAPTANSVLKWDGSKWMPSVVKLSELTNLTGGSAFNAGACTAAQTLNWSSITDKFECQNIAIANTQVSGLGTASTKAAGTGANEVLLLDGSGRIPASALPSALGQWQASGTKLYYDDGVIVAGGSGTAYTGTNQPFVVKGDAGQMSQLILDRGSSLLMLETNGLQFSLGKCNTTTCSGMTNYLYADFASNRLDIGAGASSNNGISLLSSGYAGLGTQAPSYRLDIQSSEAFQQRLFHASNADYNGAALMLTRTRGTVSSNSAVNSGNTIGGLYFRAHDGSGTNTTNTAIEVSATENQTTTTRGSQMIFETTNTGSATRTEKMRIAGNGNVGIGTTNPGSLLEVNGVIHSSSGGFKFPDGSIQTTAAGVSGQAQFDSGWTTMAGGNYYIFNHGLGVIPSLIRVIAKDNATGKIIDISPQYAYGYSNYAGLNGVTSDSTTIKISTYSINRLGSFLNDSNTYLNMEFATSQVRVLAWAHGVTSSIWSQSGLSTYYNAGDVGIGTTTPTAKLDVNGKIRGVASVAYDSSSPIISTTSTSSTYSSDISTSLNVQSGDLVKVDLACNLKNSLSSDTTYMRSEVASGGPAGTWLQIPNWITVSSTNWAGGFSTGLFKANGDGTVTFQAYWHVTGSTGYATYCNIIAYVIGK